MLVDDSVKNPKKKREAILNPNFKYIGISASDINANQEENGEKNKEENNENNNNGNNGENPEGNNDNKKK